MKREVINENLALKAPKLVTLEDKSLIYVSLMGEYGSLNYNDAYQRLWGVVKSQKLFTKGIESLCISYDDPKVTEANQQRSDVCLAIHKPANPKMELAARRSLVANTPCLHIKVLTKTSLPCMMKPCDGW